SVRPARASDLAAPRARLPVPGNGLGQRSSGLLSAVTIGAGVSLVASRLSRRRQGLRGAAAREALVFIDGEAGTTGLQVRERLAKHPGIEVLSLEPGLRKDENARRDALHKADAAVLCLPDDAAIAAVALAEGSDTVIVDASTAYRIADGWAYGFPELSASQAGLISKSKRISNPGCYPTGFIGLTRPLVDAGLLLPDAALVAVRMSTTAKLVAEPMVSPPRPTALPDHRMLSCATLACTPVRAQVAGPGCRRSDLQGVEIFEGTSPRLSAHESRATAMVQWRQCLKQDSFQWFSRATPGVSAVKIQNYTLEDMKLNKKDAKKAMDKKAAEAEKFLCTSVDEPEGDVDLLVQCLAGMNEEPDPIEEERKGDAGRVGKMVFSAGLSRLAVPADVPEEEQSEFDCAEWLEYVLMLFNAERLQASPESAD
ncbi:unnamed protein product, partial [Polarella glacialis]